MSSGGRSGSLVSVLPHRSVDDWFREDCRGAPDVLVKARKRLAPKGQNRLVAYPFRKGVGNRHPDGVLSEASC